MRAAEIKDALGAIADLKSQLGFSIVDTHFHPYDVMGAVPPHKHHHDDAEVAVNPMKAGILEVFEYDRLAKLGTSLVSRAAPGFFRSTIVDTFNKFTDAALLSEMDYCGVDYVCAMPIEPWSSTQKIAERYRSNPRVKVLASVPIHSIEPREVGMWLQESKSRYGIVGIKLHPNLQNFNPQPSQNDERVRDVLIETYQASERLGLYLHFHAGSSYYTTAVDSVYAGSERSRTKGLLEHFLNADGSSELFGRYDIPIVLAHLASYGVADIDSANIGTASSLHKNLFFDTSGVSPRIISNFVCEHGYADLVYGSDGPYNRMAYNMAFLYEGLSRSLPKSEMTVAIPQVFGQTYRNRVNIK